MSDEEATNYDEGEGFVEGEDEPESDEDDE